MSIYCIGKLVSACGADCKSSLQAAADQAGLAVTFDTDPEDRKVLDEPSEISGYGLTFSVTSGPADSDVVTAWNSAREGGLKKLGSISGNVMLPDCDTRIEEVDLPQAVLQELVNSGIGKFTATLIERGVDSSGGLAFFDGCIEQTIVGEPGECLRRILKGFLIPWHCGPNALYVWTRQ